jgi:hypothetical protein
MNARRKSRLSTKSAAAGVILMTLAAALPAPAGTFSYTGAFQFCQGNYFFDLTTKGLVFLNGFSFSSRRFTLGASLPLVYQSSPYVTYSGVGLLPSGGAESSTVSQRQGREIVLLPEVVESSQYGVGDPVLRMGIRVLDEGPARPSLELVAQVKAPVASLESGFGTGAWDYGVGVSLAKRLAGVLVFADVSHWTLGDLPELELKDPWVYSASFGVPFARGRSALLVSYFGMTEVIDAVAPPAALGLGLSLKIGPKTSLMLNGSFGLSEASPDFTASVGWSIGF